MDSLASPSQWDPSVLKEMPPEILAELRAAVRHSPTNAAENNGGQMDNGSPDPSAMTNQSMSPVREGGRENEAGGPREPYTPVGESSQQGDKGKQPMRDDELMPAPERSSQSAAGFDRRVERTPNRIVDITPSQWDPDVVKVTGQVDIFLLN
jgi:hypothetical protein